MVNEPLIRPGLNPDEALRLAREGFGVSASRAEPLPSDRDQNFLLEEKESGRRFVLKLGHAGEDPRVLDFQNRILEHLGRAGFSLSKVLHSTDGEELVEVPGPDHAVFRARLLSWVPGVVFHTVHPTVPEIFRSLGTFLGGMDRVLEDFSHPVMDRELKWDLKQAGRVVRSHLEMVEDAGRRALLEEMNQRFLERLGPLLPDLRMSVIHGDANDHNILVSEAERGGAPQDRRVVGLVDFGDAVRSYTVGEVAIAGAYAMLERDDPFAAAVEVLAGYHRAYPLREAEVEAALPLMGLRLCQSVAIAAHQKKREPDNGYLTVSEAPAWALLEKLEGENLDFPHYLFRWACEMEPVPGSRVVVDWLRENGHAAAPVVGADLRDAPLHVFDLSMESGELGLAPEADDARAWTGLLFQTMETMGAEIGIGRYDEIRGWYTSDIFRPRGEDGTEWRTLHMGVDLFLEAGSPVQAPYDAVVHSVANNANPLDYGPTVILEHRVGEARDRSDHGGARRAQGSFRQGGPAEPVRFWTLYGHLADDILERLRPGQPVAAGETFARIGNYPDNGNWAPHLHFQIIVDPLGMEGDFPGVARPSQRALWKALSPDPNLILGIPESPSLRPDPHPSLTPPFSPGARPGHPSGSSLTPRKGRSPGEIHRVRQRHLGPNLSVSYQRPLKIVRGRREFLFDHQGQSYLDCVNNVPHVGHAHPRVVEAGRRQMTVLNTNTRYLHDLTVEYAHRLLATLPDPLSVVYFVNSGSEANELALRLARAHTGRTDVVVVEGGYHGNTAATVDLSSYKFDGPGGRGAPPWVHTTPMPDPYRGLFRASSDEAFVQGLPLGSGSPEEEEEDDQAEYLPPEELGPRYAQEVERVLAEMDGERGTPAAFFCEPLLGCGGQIVPPDGYLSRAYRHIRKAGGVCVADEVQVGFGRVGSHFWAFETQGVVPDILTLGKPMGNGHPLSAVITTSEIAGSFDTGMEFFSTFGGNPVSCAIGMAVLDVLEDEGLQGNARAKGDHLLEGLRELRARHPLIGEVRGKGLFIGVELVESRDTRRPATARAHRVKERMRDHHILLSTDGPDANVLKIKPPLVFTRGDADRVVSTLDRVLTEDGIRD